MTKKTKTVKQAKPVTAVDKLAAKISKHRAGVKTWDRKLRFAMTMLKKHQQALQAAERKQAAIALEAKLAELDALRESTIAKAGRAIDFSND